MTTENDRLRALAPISDEEVAALALDGERALASAIMAKPRRRPFTLLRGDGQGSRPPLAALVASVALIALAGVGVAIGIGGSSPAGGPAGAGGPAATGVEGTREQLPERVSTTAPATTVPAATVPDAAVELLEREAGAQPPRYLLDGDGWRVSRVDELERDGEMTFRRGEVAFELAWRTGPFEQWLDDRAHDADRLEDVEVDGGKRAAVFAGRDGRGFYTALWQVGDFTLEFRVTVVPTEAGTALAPSARLSATEFGDALRSLRIATLREWLAAVPDRAVRLDERPREVEAMLADVPLPPGFDTAPLKRGEIVKDRYQLGATVIGSVACGWLDFWTSARRARARAGVARAADAMASVGGSAILREMETEGAYPGVVRDLAAAVSGDGTIDQGKPDMPVEDVYPSALGCDSR